MNRLSLTALFLASLAAACGASSDDEAPPSAKKKQSNTGTISSDREDTSDEKPTAKDDAKTPIAEALAVTEVALFQGVKVSLAAGGAEAVGTNAPIVANRPGLVRVYVEPQVSWTKARSLQGTLTVTDGTGKELGAVTASASILKASTDEVLSSTFNFELGAELFTTAGLSYAFSAHLSTDEAATDAVRFPAEGSSAPATVAPDPGVLKVRLVPVTYKADGSNRLPDTGDSAVAAYRDMVYRMYPASKVEVTVRKPIDWTKAIKADGTGWDDLLETIYQVRGEDRPEGNVYYVGLFAPAATMGQYCRGGCVLGLAPLAGAGNIDERVATVAGISYRVAAESLAHEVGHSHGRNHSPCGGAASPEPTYPYEGAKIGSWGYDLLDKVLYSPDETRDFMGYCEPTWVSDFTFTALYSRMTTVKQQPGSTQSSSGPNPGLAQTHKVFRVRADGTATALRTKQGPVPEGKSVSAHYVGSKGQRLRQANAHFVPFDHLPGGFLYVPEDAAASSVDVEGIVPSIVHASLR